MADKPKRHEPETYELADPNESAAGAPSPPAKPQPAKPTRPEAEAATYELEEVAAKPGAAPQTDVAKLAGDPRFAPEEPPPAAAPQDKADKADKPDKPRVKTSVFTPEEVEPAYVSPEVAAQRREEARVRAAAVAAVEDAKRRKRNLIVFAALAIAALIGVVVWKLAS